MKSAWILLLLLISAYPLSAQPKQGQALIDSLKDVLTSNAKDTNRVLALNELAFACLYSEPASTVRYAGEALALAEKLKWTLGIVKAYNNLGNASLMLSDYHQALKYYQLSLKSSESLNNKTLESNILGNIGLVYMNISDYPKALEYYFKSLEMAKAAGNIKSQMNNGINIGNVYLQLKKYQKALEFYHEALIIAQHSNNQRGMSQILGSIGMANMYLPDYPKAENSLKESYRIGKETGDLITASNAIHNLGTLYYLQKEYDKALSYFFQSLTIARDMKNKNLEAGSLGNIGEVYNKMGQYTKAIDYTLQSNTIAEQIGVLEIQKNALQNLADNYEKLHRPEEALTAYKKYMVLSDSILNAEKESDMSRKEMQFDFDKKKLADSISFVESMKTAELKLSRQRAYAYAGYGGLVLFLALSFFIFKNYRNQKKSNIIIVKEKQRSDDLLLNILPEEVANELKSTGEAEARQYNNVTVIFTDFVNFTGISEQMSPKELVKAIHRNFTGFDKIMEDNGLEKIKTIGDAYLAVAGLPNEDPDHALKVLKAAKEIQDFIRNENDKFEVRIGVHSGPVVAGIVGVKKYAYDIWGDTVNTAARMQQLSDPGKINISASTFKLVKDKIACSYRGKIAAKNKGEIDMYFVD